MDTILFLDTIIIKKSLKVGVGLVYIWQRFMQVSMGERGLRTYNHRVRTPFGTKINWIFAEYILNPLTLLSEKKI